MLAWRIILLSIATVGLLIIPLVFDRKLYRLDNKDIDLEKENKKYERAREKSHNALKEHDTLKIIHNMYLNSVPNDKQVTFINDNIDERLREATRIISFWKENINQYLEIISLKSTNELYNEIELNETIFTLKHNEILQNIDETKKRKNKLEAAKRAVLIFTIIVNLLGIIFGIISTLNSEKKTQLINDLIIEKLK